MPQYKLIYADSRGYAEVARQIFAYAKVPYEDYRFDFRTLTAEKKQELGLPWGQIPVLEIDGTIYGQSLSFTRYLARKYGLTGKDELEELKCDEIVDAFRDFQSKFMPLFMVLVKPGPTGEIDTAKLEEMLKPIREVEAPKQLDRFNKLLEQSPNGHFVPSGFTWADLYMVVGITQLEQIFQVKFTNGFTALEKLIERVENLPGIKEWIETRPKTTF